MNETTYKHVFYAGVASGLLFNFNQTVVFPEHSQSARIHFKGTSAHSGSQRSYCELDYSESYGTMLASQNVLAKDWDHPDEDAAWANL